MDFSGYGEEFKKLRPSVKLKELEEIFYEWEKIDTKTNRFPIWMSLMKAWYYLIELPSPEFLKRAISHHPYVIGRK